MTVVFPTPVASFGASRMSSGLASLFAAAEVLEQALSSAGLVSDLGQPDRGLRRLDLTEERARTAELVMAPMLEKAGGLPA